MEVILLSSMKPDKSFFLTSGPLGVHHAKLQWPITKKCSRTTKKSGVTRSDSLVFQLTRLLTRSRVTSRLRDGQQSSTTMSEMESVLLTKNSVSKVFLMLLLSILKERLFSSDIQLPENLKKISTTFSLVKSLLGQEPLQLVEMMMVREKVASNQMLLLTKSMDSLRPSTNFQIHTASKIQLRKQLQVCQELSVFLSMSKSSIAKQKSSVTILRTIKSLLVLKIRSPL